MNKETSTRNIPRVLAITGGKGGVGKTSLAVNLSIALARNGSKVCLFDADTGLANINIMLGIHPPYTLEHLFTGEKTIQDIVVKGPEGIQIVPGASGFAQCVELDVGQQQRLVTSIRAIEPHYDYMLVDTAAGISPTVLHFIAASQVAVIVVTPEPTSLTDAFSLVKVLKRRGYRRKVQVVVNMCSNSSQAEKVFRRFSQAVRKYLTIESEYLGSVWMDESMRSAVTLQRPVALFPKNDPSARSFYRLAERIDDVFTRPGVPRLAFSAYWQKLVEAYAARRQESLQPIDGAEGARSEPREPELPKAQLKVVPSRIPRSEVENVSRPQLANVVDMQCQHYASSQGKADVPDGELSAPEKTDANPKAAGTGPEVDADRAEAQITEKSLPGAVSTMGAEPPTQIEKQLEDHQQQQRLEQQVREAHASADGQSSSEAMTTLNATSEHQWIDLRVQMSRFIANPDTTPEQVITLISSCIFGFGDRLGSAAHDLLHGLLATMEPGSLDEEQALLLRSEVQRLGILDDTTGPEDAIEVEEDKPERYDAEGFGSQQELADAIRVAKDKVPLESLLESIKYASLVDGSND